MTRTTTTTTISQLWDLIETWCFHKYINDNDKDNKDDKGISALGFDSKGHLIIKFTDRGIYILALRDFKKVVYKSNV